MAQLRDQYDMFVNQNTEIIVLGPEQPEKFAQYWAKERLPFRGVPDPQHTVLDLYGQETRLLKLGRMPAQALVDINGIIRYAHYGSSMSDIPANGEILSQLS